MEAGERLGRSCRHDRRASTIAAYVIAATAFYPQLYVYLEQAGLADAVRGLGSNGIVAAAVPLGFVVAVVISLLTRRPGVAQRQFAEALIRPRDFPVDDERE